MSKVTIHVLRHGRALCGLPGLPRDWPEGHRWVSSLSVEEATCAPCKARHEELRREYREAP